MMDNQVNLINYLPEFLRDIREYKVLTAVEDSEINLLLEGVEAAFNDQAVDTATEYGVSRLEKIMNINKKSTDLDARKTEIKTKLGQQLPYTEYTLRKALAEICPPGKSGNDEESDGFQLQVLQEEYTVKVLISLWNKSKRDVVDAMIRQVVPANMLCLVDIKYNAYEDLQRLKFSHEQLSGFTHKEICDDVW